MGSAPSRLHSLAGEAPPTADTLPILRKGSLPVGFVGGLLIAVLGGLLTVMLVSGSDHRRPVLAIARPVAPGDPITGADLKVVRVGADTGVAVIAAEEQRRMIGRVAATRLSPGSLLVPSALGSASVIPAGEAGVGLLLEPGRFPPNLQTGDHVVVVSAPTGPAAAAVATSLAEATVESITGAPGGSGILARLRLDRASATVVAAEGAARRVALVVVSAAASPASNGGNLSYGAVAPPQTASTAPTAGASDGSGVTK